MEYDCLALLFDIKCFSPANGMMALIVTGLLNLAETIMKNAFDEDRGRR